MSLVRKRTGVSTMTQSTFTYMYQATKRRGINYVIGVRVDPSLEDPRSFAAILFFRLSDGTVVEVCKVDNSPHEGLGDVHVDRYYRVEGAAIKDFDVEIDGWDEADRYLKENAHDMVDRYYENHGAEPRMDEANI